MYIRSVDCMIGFAVDVCASSSVEESLDEDVRAVYPMMLWSSL